MLPDDLITVADAAKLLRRNIWSVYGWVSERKMPNFKIGGRRYVRRVDLEKMISFVPAAGRPLRRPNGAEPIEATE